MLDPKRGDLPGMADSKKNTPEVQEGTYQCDGYALIPPSADASFVSFGVAVTVCLHPSRKLNLSLVADPSHFGSLQV